MKYTDQQRKQIGQDAVGKTIQSMEWEPQGQYWVITFEDDSELCVRLMTELTKVNETG